MTLQMPTAITSVLIVDDEAETLNALHDLLDHEGYGVQSVALGKEAIARIQDARFGAVILDMRLPDIDGQDVLRTLRERVPEVPVIVLTAYATEENTIGSLQNGAFAYLTKPYRAEEVIATVQRAVAVGELAAKARTVESALNESEGRFRSVVQSAHDAIILADEHGAVVFWNPGAQRMFGYTEDEMLTHPLTSIMPERYREAHQRGLLRARSTRTPSLIGRTLELSGLRKNGEEFPLELSLATWETERGVCYGGIIRDITERKRAEDALRRSEERFRQLAENIKEVFWLTEPGKTEMIYISPAYEDVWGRSCASLYDDPRSWMEAIHPHDRERVRHAAFTKQTNGTYHEEYRIIRSDGGVRWICDRAFPIRSDGGDVYRIAGIAEDITADKIAERRQATQYAVTRILADSTSFRAAAAKILQAICEQLDWDIAHLWTMDESTRTLSCVGSRRAATISAAAFEGLTREMKLAPGVGLPGRVWASGEAVWIPDISEDPNFPRAAIAVQDGLRSALAFPISWNGEILGVFEFFSCEVRPQDADLLRMLEAIGSQIGQFTERKEAQEALRLAYEKIDAVLVSLPCSILLVDDALRILYANPLARQHFGREQSPAGGALRDTLMLAERDWELLLGELDAARTADRPVVDREFTADKRRYRYRLFPVALRDGIRHQIGMVIWDVTEQKQLHDQLIQAEKLASLGTLVSGMAHEINNPVQGILGMAEIILQEHDSERIKEYAGDIVRYALHVGEVVRNFACYARPSSNDAQVNLDINERLIEAVRMVQRCPQFGHVEVVTDFARIPRVRARKTEIDQVLVNLISNAVEAMNGRGRLTLATEAADSGVVARISDTGCGIPATLLSKIFDPFVTTKDPGKGTGLGLSIAFRIVDKYGGRLTVESEEGKGTTFTMCVPSGEEGGAS